MRPLNRQEQSEGFAWKIENNAMFQVDPATHEPDRVRDVRYMLDHIFGPKQSTREIYATTAQGLIQKLVHGFNSTVFAYGQTSSGKTHTMRGTPDEPGIIAMAVQEVFSLIEHSQDREFLLRVSYMEVRPQQDSDCVAGAVQLPQQPISAAGRSIHAVAPIDSSNNNTAVGHADAASTARCPDTTMCQRLVGVALSDMHSTGNVRHLCRGPRAVETKPVLQ